MFYFIALLVDGRIHEAQIHPDPDSEPEHLFLGHNLEVSQT
jgi:hypothetical protein